MSNRSPRILILIVILIALGIWIILPSTTGFQISALKVNKVIQTRLGLDLVGGVQAMLEADLPPGTPVTAESMATARQIVENRVNGLGVTEAVVQQAGDRRIVVEMPGETDPAKALATIQQTGLLEFVDLSQYSATEIAQFENMQVQTDFNTGGSSEPTPSATGTITGTQGVTTTGTLTTTPLLHTVMTGAELKTVGVTTSPTTGQYEVSFELTPTGAETFKNFTSAHVGQILAIVLDKKIISSPRIDSAITAGSGVIQGNFNLESANNLAIQLRYGSLPIPLKVVTSQTVGPTLGSDSLRKSLIAGTIGLLVVILFMGLYYRLPGTVADLALLIYALFSFAIFKFIPVTLTLPGIAGFVLSIGVAVDANILIFERLKEELRAGRSLHQAIDMGWSRAWPSIRDSNFSTLITCGILFWFGSTFGASIVKGFSLTLAIGVLVSLFTAVVVTRTILHLVLDRIDLAEHHEWFGV